MNPIQNKIRALRGRLTRWILVRGIGQWLLIAIVVLLIDMGLDRFFKMDFAQRAVMLSLTAIGLSVLFFWKVLRPIWLRPSDDALVYEVEKKNPQLKESLLSAMQLDRQKSNTAELAGVSQQLVDVTIQKGFDDAAKVNFAGVLDLGQQRINWLLFGAGLLLAAVIGIGSASHPFLKTWFNRNVLLTSEQWPQETYLQLVGVRDGKLRIPRGSDHRQLVQVLDNSSVTDVAVTLEMDTPTGRSNLPMKLTGNPAGTEHVLMLHNVSTGFRLRAIGGDDTTEWVEVELVEPPAIAELVIAAKPPAYTGVESQELVGPGPFAILKNSYLDVRVVANKPVAEAVVVNGQNKIVLPADKQQENRFAGRVPEKGALAGGEYEIRLMDEEGVKNSRRSKFKIAITSDKPPVLRASMLGISGLIVSRATIPVSFQANDEYGFAELGFDCAWIKDTEDNNPDDQAKRVVFATKGQPGLLAEPTAKVDDVVALEMSTFDLLPGTTFRFSVFGKDEYPDADNTGTSQEFLLKVVTDAELRADLLRREIEQRQAFDKAYQTQLTLATELQAIVARTPEAGQSEADYIAARERALITATRAQKSIGTSVVRIADRFEEFLVEVKNNKLDEAENAMAPDQRIEIRFDQRIIRPIRALDENLVSLAARHMDHCRALINDPKGLTAAADQADQTHQEILEQMKLILSAMTASEGFQGIINELISIREGTDDMIEREDAAKLPEEKKIDENKIFD